MANYPVKPPSYVVNTAHAKCPDILYMMDEATGTQLTDKGKANLGLHMTLQNASQCTTVAMNGGDAPAINVGSGLYALTQPNVSVTSSIAFVAIMQSDNATKPSSRETIVAIGTAASTAEILQIPSATTSTGFPIGRIVVSEGTNSIASTVDAWDGTLHMVAGRFYQTTNLQVARPSVDGSSWSQTSSVTGGTIKPALNRIGVGSTPFPTPTEPFTGKLVSLFVYLNNNAAWDDAFISDLAANPWQFLNAGSTSLKVRVNADAAGVGQVSGVVFSEEDNLVIGKFENQTFETALEGGEAVLLVPVEEFGGDGLSPGTTLSVWLYSFEDEKETGIIPAEIVAAV